MLTVCKTTHQRIPLLAEAKKAESARDDTRKEDRMAASKAFHLVS